MPQGDKMIHRDMFGGVIVDADAGVEAVVRRNVDADDRHIHGLELAGFIRFDVEGAHHNGIGVAADRQVGEEVPAFVGVRHGEYGDVVPCRVEDGIKTGVDTRIEPGNDGFAQQQCDAERLPRLQCCSGSGNAVVEFFRGGHDALACFRQNEVGLGEGA